MTQPMCLYFACFEIGFRGFDICGMRNPGFNQCMVDITNAPTDIKQRHTWREHFGNRFNQQPRRLFWPLFPVAVQFALYVPIIEARLDYLRLAAVHHDSLIREEILWTLFLNFESESIATLWIRCWANKNCRRHFP
jgi:hypothetical protein